MIRFFNDGYVLPKCILSILETLFKPLNILFVHNLIIGFAEAYLSSKVLDLTMGVILDPGY